MASKPKQDLEIEEEERISIQETDSDESKGERPSTVQQTVSKPATSQTQSHTKKLKATGTPLPAGHGSTHRREGDQITSARKRPKGCRRLPTPDEIPAPNNFAIELSNQASPEKAPRNRKRQLH
ncbi:hypothetical protein NDU88_003788 [Pleurodeles waltl]|uniref:Uncharacterized protein n=1 Tax=Pleurodeles waltl TaxID=8319 RepID=A0AAV7KVX3_PLEWA|nr:hypothetical protein NDU88_003788 [Pleurodeles waltl]